MANKKDTYTIEKRLELIDSCKNSLKELNKVINQEIQLDALEPERAKQAVQGKLEAAKGYNDMLEIITTQTVLVQNERAALNDDKTKTSFSTLEDRIK